MPAEAALPTLVPGTLGLWAGLVASVLAVALYYVVGRQLPSGERPLTRRERRDAQRAEEARSAQRTLLLARRAFWVATAASLLTAAYLMALILTHRFEVPYVAEVSSRRLQPFYLVASFWGGQQGSFLLWLVSTCLTGLVVIRTARAYEAQVMTFVSMLPACLFWILIVRSPFTVTASAPPDGQGMSPLLENPWMTIHPPVLFVGFAATVVVYAYAAAGLWRRDYDGWARAVLPWNCFTYAVLGAGVCLGGYWAYSTLGWGGFWGWDPVENSSLFPWVVSAILMHTLLVQRTKGTWHRTNAVLGLVPFLAVLYSTFLTRSGILSDFSVHSFGSLGILWWLVGGMALFTLLGFGLFALRWKDLPRKESTETGYTLESAIYWGAVLLGLFGMVVIVATSWPVLGGLMASLRERVPALAFLPAKAASPDPGWYNRMVTPLGILMAVAIGTAPLVKWFGVPAGEVWRKARGPLALSLAATVVAYALGVTRPEALLLVLTGSWAAFANLAPLARRPVDLGKLGAHAAHAGLGLMLIGIVGSSLYGTKHSATLVQGEKQKVGDYEVELRGFLRPQGHLKQQADVRITQNGRTLQARPTVHLHQAFGREAQWITWPHVKKMGTHDLYVAPAGGALTTDDLTARSGELTAGQAVRDGAYAFEVDPHPVMLGTQGDEAEIGVNVSVTGPMGREVLTPTLFTHTRTFVQRQGQPAATRDGQLRLRVTRLEDLTTSDGHSEIGKAAIQISGPALGAPAVNRNVLQIEISTKPLIDFVWLGTLLCILGGLVAAWNRAREARRAEERARQEGLHDEPASAIPQGSPLAL